MTSCPVTVDERPLACAVTEKRRVIETLDRRLRRRREGNPHRVVRDGLARDQAAPGEGGYDALGELPGLLEVRVAREDEVVDAEVGVLADPLGDLLVGAHQRGPGTTAHQADARPEV